MLVIPYRSSVMSLTKVAARGVSSSGLSMPNTVLDGRFSKRPARSAVTTISPTAVAGEAGGQG